MKNNFACSRRARAAARLLALLSLLNVSDPVSAALKSTPEPHPDLTSTHLPAGIRPTIPFHVFIPDDYNENTAYPVVVYLHGVGGSYNGGVNQQNIRNNYNAALAAGVIGPVIMVIPDGYQKTFTGYDTIVDAGWSDSHPDATPIIPAESDVWDIINYVDQTYHTRGDAGRVIIGHSMGGSGSAKFAAKYPAKFRAWVGFDAPLNEWTDDALDQAHYGNSSDYFDQAGNPWYWVANNSSLIIAHGTRFRQVQATIDQTDPLAGLYVTGPGGKNPRFRTDYLMAYAITDFPAMPPGGMPNEEYIFVNKNHSDTQGIFAADGPNGTHSWVLIQEAISNPPASYTIEFTSSPVEDGHVLEATTGGTGGTVNSTSANLIIGDDAGDEQYKTFLSFDTAALLPDNAIIDSATLRLTRTVSQNSILGTLKAYIKAGYFSTSSTLQSADWQSTPALAISSVTIPGAAGLSSTTPLNGANALANINRLATTGGGKTQLLLSFSTADNGNGLADTLGFASANHTIASRRPVLSVTYHLP